MGEIFMGGIALLLLGMVLFLLYSALRDGAYLLAHKSGLQKLFVSRSMREHAHTYLQASAYYMALSERGKKRFLDRLFTFMYNKEFEGAEGLVVTEEMCVLISAAAVQLTFGLQKFKLANLETIIIFPGNFHLGTSKTSYKGATVPQGRMYLSWSAFREGNANPNDQVNLGLHEMTHALKLSLSLGSGFDTYFASRIDLWESMAVTELERLRARAQEFLRPYGRTNMAEFFPVCAEAFFENPKAFATQLPELYNYMVFLLNQDPANAINDYAVMPDYFTVNRIDIPVMEVRRSYKYNNWHWSLSLLLFGVLGGFLSLGFFFNHLVLPYYGYILAFVIVGTLGLLQKRYFENRNILRGAFFYLYAYMGFGVSVVTLLMWANFFIPIGEKQRDTFIVNNYTRIWHVSSHSGVQTDFEGYALSIDDNSGLYNASLLLVKDPPPSLPAKVNFTYQRGLLGVKVLQGYSYTKE